MAWLRARGHDVVYAAENLRRWPDSELLELARADGRTIITDDKDFGDLIFHRKMASHGVILLRLASTAIEETWAHIENELPGRFIVVTDRKVRVRLST